MPEVEFAKYVSATGITGILMAVIWFLLKGTFVTGREHTATLAFVNTLQTELASFRSEMAKLRERDDAQQRDLTDLREQLAKEQSLKVDALEKLTEAQRVIESLKGRVAELERQINPLKTVQT